jgi:hypothetical protein
MDTVQHTIFILETNWKTIRLWLERNKNAGIKRTRDGALQVQKHRPEEGLLIYLLAFSRMIMGRNPNTSGASVSTETITP